MYILKSDHPQADNSAALSTQLSAIQPSRRARGSGPGPRGAMQKEKRHEARGSDSPQLHIPHSKLINSLQMLPLRGLTPLQRDAFSSTNMTGGARIRPAEPGWKAGTDRRNTVGTTVTERIPEGRTGFYKPVRGFRPAKRLRIALGGQGAKRKCIPYSSYTGRGARTNDHRAQDPRQCLRHPSGLRSWLGCLTTGLQF
jgi:hypothetical protein